MEDLMHSGEQVRQISGKLKDDVDWTDVQNLFTNFHKTVLIQTFPGDSDPWLKNLFVVYTSASSVDHVIETLNNSNLVEFAQLVPPRYLAADSQELKR